MDEESLLLVSTSDIKEILETSSTLRNERRQETLRKCVVPGCGKPLSDEQLRRGFVICDDCEWEKRHLCANCRALLFPKEISEGLKFCSNCKPSEMDIEKEPEESSTTVQKLSDMESPSRMYPRKKIPKILGGVPEDDRGQSDFTRFFQDDFWCDGATDNIERQLENEVSERGWCRLRGKWT